MADHGGFGGGATPDARARRLPLPSGPRPPVVTDPRQRRLLGWELLIVLAVFPLPAVVAAAQSLTANVVDGYQPVTYATVPVAGHPLLSAPLAAAQILLPLAGAALALFSLVRSGEGWRAIGLGRPARLEDDLGVVLPVFLVANVVAQLGVGLALGALGLRSIPTDPGALPKGYLAILVLSSVVAGVTEEIVVLGYLVHRLEQRGWRAGWVVAVAVAVRCSYHVYYGVGVLGIAAWALASVLLYRHYRRLPAFIVVHVLWDATLFGAVFYSGGVVAGVMLATSVPSIVLWARARGRRRAPAWPPSVHVPAWGTTPPTATAPGSPAARPPGTGPFPSAPPVPPPPPPGLPFRPPTVD